MNELFGTKYVLNYLLVSNTTNVGLNLLIVSYRRGIEPGELLCSAIEDWG